MEDCGSDWTCVKPKFLRYISEIVQKDELKLTRDLSFERTQTGEDEEQVANSVTSFYRPIIIFKKTNYCFFAMVKIKY